MSRTSGVEKESVKKETTMPAKSGKQYRLMQAIAHGSAKTGLGGPSKAVAREFVEETPPEKRSKFARGLKNAKKRPKRY